MISRGERKPTRGSFDACCSASVTHTQIARMVFTYPLWEVVFSECGTATHEWLTCKRHQAFVHEARLSVCPFKPDER